MSQRADPLTQMLCRNELHVHNVEITETFEACVYLSGALTHVGENNALRGPSFIIFAVLTC